MDRVTDQPEQPPTEALTRRSLRESVEPAPAGAAAAAGPVAGIRALIAKHPTAWLAATLAVIFLMLATSALFAGIAVGSSSSEAAPLPTESSAPPRTQPSAVPAASVIRTCSIAGPAADPALATFSGIVMNAATGEVLFDRNGTAANPTGSVLKVLTAAAALSALGPDFRFTTQVVEGSAPGSIVLVGGGDPTLASGSDNVYPQPASMQALADQVTASWQAKHGDDPITQVIVDATLWNPVDSWDDSWNRKEQVDGYQAEVTALMVDGDRDNPGSLVSSRSDDPIARATDAFLDALGADGASVTSGSAASSQVLGSVQSAPLSSLVEFMLLTSDNVLAENLARMVSVHSGLDGSAASLGQAIPSALAKYGVPAQGLTIRDGSGLSALNGVPPKYIAELMIKVAAEAEGLALIKQSLPVAGVSGTLSGRFTGDNAVAAGQVYAKTGWLDDEYALAGAMSAADGTALTFAFTAIRPGVGLDSASGDAAKYALDTITAAAFRCGNNLSNN